MRIYLDCFDSDSAVNADDPSLVERDENIRAVLSLLSLTGVRLSPADLGDRKEPLTASSYCSVKC